VVRATSAFTFEDAFAQLGQARLGHKDRTTRLVDSAQRIADHPGGTLPAKLHCPAAYQGTLRLINKPTVTHASVMEPHYAATLQQARQSRSTVLFIHDTTELDYSGQQTLSSLGPIGKGTTQGYLAHHSLAVDADTGEMIGLAQQILHTREAVPAKEGVKAKRERKSRESRLWVRAVERVGPAPAESHWVDVCDRGADTFEMLDYEMQHQRHFVIRSSHNRALVIDQEPHLLHDYLRAQPSMTSWQVQVSTNGSQTARLAQVNATWQAVQVRSPHVRRGKHGHEPLSLWALRVWEPQPPPEVNQPLEWILLTDEPITDEQSARRLVRYYELRPRVEELHKAQKTGLGIEQLQLQSQAGLQPMIALLSILAVALVNARYAARDEERAEQPATEYFDPLWVLVLSIWRYEQVRPLTVREYVMALGRLGGHLNRKCDGLPGWQTLWKGTMQLQTMVEYEKSRRLCDKL
jgi:hypothetical protein